MGIEKAEIKESVLKDVEGQLDTQLKGLRNELAEYRGGKKGLRQQAANLAAIVNIIKEDLDEGKFEKMEPIEFAKYTIQKIQHCVEATKNASQHYEALELQAQGAITAINAARSRFEKSVELERSKIENIEQMAEGDDKDPRNRPVGVRPAANLKAERTAEKKTKKTTKKTTRKTRKKVNA